ncbi:MAG: hypothetical protein JWN56_966 [Sphingobacteriales bacterium]|nr:hypothetical protein [Sphingobacteriales bacterium]
MIMHVLSAHYLGLFVWLNRQLTDEYKWLVYNKLLVFHEQDKFKAFHTYNDAKQYAAISENMLNRNGIIPIKPLFIIIRGVLRMEDTPLFLNIDNYLKPSNFKLMNTKNLEFLQSNLKYLGFGEQLNADMEKGIDSRKPEFKLKVEIPHFNKKVDYALHFKKSDSTDMYFFNRYDATLKTGKPEQDKTQSFYINKATGVTAKEAFNLLDGRSVFKNLFNKDGEKYGAWLKLDLGSTDDKGNHKLRQFTEQYGFKLEKSLAGLPIKELHNPDEKNKLISSLERGNLQQVTMGKDGNESKYYIEAAPQFKNVNVYGQKMQIVKRQSLQSENPSSSPSVTKSEKPNQKQEVKATIDEGEPKQKQGRKRKMSF